MTAYQSSSPRSRRRKAASTRTRPGPRRSTPAGSVGNSTTQALSRVNVVGSLMAASLPPAYAVGPRGTTLHRKQASRGREPPEWVTVPRAWRTPGADALVVTHKSVPAATAAGGALAVEFGIRAKGFPGPDQIVRALQADPHRLRS